MHGEIHFLDLIFRWTLFSLLVYKVASLIKTYLYPLLADHIIREKNQQTEFLEKDKLLISTRHRIENQIFNQKKMLTFLEKNVQVWHATITEQAGQEERLNRENVEKIREKRIVQAKNIALDQQINLAIPPALQAAREHLINHYNQEVGSHVLYKMIDQIGNQTTTITSKNG
jgi:hypothetical protein